MGKYLLILLISIQAFAAPQFPFSFWKSAAGNFIVATCGGSETIDGNYKVCTFTSNGNFNVTSAPGGATAEYLIVAGGGGDNSTLDWPPGGGGGGGLLHATGYTLSVQNYSITVGTGGAINANGTNSVFDSHTAVGGGYGGGGSTFFGVAENGASGGSGGGGGQYLFGQTTAGLGTVGQGNDGYRSSSIPPDPGFEPGGGGGCDGAAPAPNYATSEDPGGAGCTFSISGSSVTYAVGGWGRNGFMNASTWAQNTGNGAGDASGSNVGRDGVVIIRYQFQ